ncbi:hypothetical protein PT974_03222 [Cladobotryum mycophilum]|uniref:Uncharacterized protein n=1 Tax=Cladobotryum mycophilum TaxID=491253 RepID=A0ABR0SSX1_9HYPO
MPLPLFLVESIGAPRNHRALFVRLDESKGNGRQFQVKGNIQDGMMYESKEVDRPESSIEYIGMSQLGWVTNSDLQRIEEICRSNPPPKKQFDGPRRIDPKTTLKCCQECTTETIRLLESEGILKPV